MASSCARTENISLSKSPQKGVVHWFTKAGLHMLPQSENGQNITIETDEGDLAASLQVSVERLQEELKAVQDRKSKLKMRPEEELEEKVFDVVVAAVNEEFFETIPGIPMIQLLMIARKHKVLALKEPGDHYVLCGTSTGIENTRKALLLLKEERRVGKESKNLEAEEKLAKRHLRNSLAGKPLDYVAGRPKGSKNKSKQSPKYDSAKEDNAEEEESSTPSGPRCSRRLSNKPRKSFVALAFGETNVKIEPPEKTESFNAPEAILSDEDGGEEYELPRKKRRKVLGTAPIFQLGDNTWRCSICDFESKDSIDNMHDHMKQHELDPSPYECDICFKSIKYLKLYGRHRVSHFQADGTLSESSMILHKKQLQQLRRKEQLKGKLLLQLKEYDEHCLANNQDSDGEVGNEKKHEESDDMAHMSECAECGMKFNTIASLRTHSKQIHEKKDGKAPRKNIATEENKLSCPHCNFVCFRVQNLTRHLKSHKKPDLYQCDQCEYTNKSRAEVLRHQRNAHQEATVGCNFCSKKFRNQVILNAHVKMKHTKEYKRTCEHCGKVLGNKMLLQKHMQTYHTGSEKQSRVMCIKCGRMLASPKKLEEHMKQTHSVDANHTEEAILTDLLEVIDETEEDGTKKQGFRCRQCTYTNRGAREVRRHIVRMHMDRAHKCDQCDKSFPVEKMLKKHIQVQHLGIEKKQCAECKKWFRNTAYLTSHAKRVHGNEKKFTCEVCHRAFYDKRNYQMHQDLHVPEDERVFRFACEYCDKQFRHQSSYDYHMKEHNGDKQFACDDCGASFRTKSSRDTHQVTHSTEKPFTCDICDKQFKLKKYLDIHVLTHTTDKYACTLCWRVFARKEALEKHVCRFVVGRDVQGRPPHYISTRYNVMVEGEEGGGDGPMADGEVAEEGADGASDSAAGDPATNMQRYLCTSCGITFVEFDEASNHQCNQPPEEVQGAVQAAQEMAPAVGEEVYDSSLQVTTANMIFNEGEGLINVDQMQRVVVSPSHQETLKGEGSAPQVSELDHMLTGMEGQTVLIAADNQLHPPTSISLLAGSADPAHMTSIVADVPATTISEEESKPEEEGARGVPSIEMYMCGLCNNLFASQADINQHMADHGVNEQVTSPLENERMESDGGDNVENTLMESTEEGMSTLADM